MAHTSQLIGDAGIAVKADICRATAARVATRVRE